MRMLENVLVTGGSGFIGSNFVRYLLQNAEFKGSVVNLDKLTYAGNPQNLQDVVRKYKGRYRFVRGDITNLGLVEDIMRKYAIDTIVHFAAESHVDRSIAGPAEFIKTNVTGTFVLLEVARNVWKNRKDVLFHHISTDEVFGSLGDTGYFFETTPYNPRSPYSASKASSDHLVNAYFHTYGLPITISNCSNNYGPYQFPEKFIPLMIVNMMEERPLPVYGDGKNIRDWLFVEDHCDAIWKILRGGKTGETYNVGGENEWTNIDLVNNLCEIVAQENEKEKDYYKRLISFVKDRPGHDRRYAINCDKIKGELDWRQSVTFEQGLRQTVKWYLSHKEWVRNIVTGEYREWVKEHYD